MKNAARLIYASALFYALWCVATGWIFQAGLAAGIKPEMTLLLRPFTTALFLFIASMMIVFYMIRIEPLLKQSRSLRACMIAGSMGIAIGLFFFSRCTGLNTPWLFAANTANLMFLAVLIGFAIIGPLSRPSEIIPLGLILALTDFFSYWAGPTKSVVRQVSQFYKEGRQGPEPAADFLLIKFAVPGIDHLQPVFGVADWVIVAFLTAAAFKFRLNDNLVGKNPGSMITDGRIAPFFPIAAAGLLLAMIAADVMGVIIPALPVIAVITLGYLFSRYPDEMKMERRERILTIVFSSALILLLAIRHFFF